ncbi:MAG: helix-turn-helix transcriptional regulator [Legionellaceae bacterium]|nr:helix-turn-helix transcriptional regulator [Legionellaceae bacterium]
MNLKKMIGSRITQARKANGLTIKALAEKTNLGVARIGNWEQGTRSPGPAETKLLSEALNVAGAWLLCLTDNQRGEFMENKNIELNNE